MPSPLERSTTLAALAGMVFWATGVSLISPHIGVGLLLCALSVFCTLWINLGSIKTMHKTNPKKWPWVGFALIAIQILVPGYILVSAAQNPPSIDCSVKSDRNSGTTIITTCPTTINPLSPRDPRALYQYGGKVGFFDHAEVNEAQKTVMFYGFHLDGARLSENIEYEKLIISCGATTPALLWPNAPAGAHIATTGPQKCSIVGIRAE